MRKFLCLAVVAGSLILGALVPQAAADTKCDVNQSTEMFVSHYHDCADACRLEKDTKGCVGSCEKFHTDCLHQMQGAKKEADRLAEKKKDEERQKEARCRAPVIACVAACTKETHNDQKKCDDKCGKNSDVQKKYRECSGH